MEKRFIIIICLLFFAMGGLFIAQSITGFYSWDRFESFCAGDSDCDAGRSCCFFYEEEYGVCDDFSACSAISKLSLEEKQQFSSLDPPSSEMRKEILFDAVKSHIEEPRADYSRNSMVVGFILIAFAVLVYVVTHKRLDSSSEIVLVKKQKKR